MNSDTATLDADEVRKIEARWMRDRMKTLGMSNAKLHEQLMAAGFEGHLNNITMWKTARNSIPHEWLAVVIKELVGNGAEPYIVEMYANRFPYLRPYFKDVGNVTLDEPSFSNRREDDVPKAIYYIPSSGKLEGKRFVPHRNRKGSFQGGVSRFSRDIEEAESFEALWRKISENPDFKVRMAPKDKSAPPSLIRQESLVIEW